MLRVSSVFVPSDRKKLRGRILLAGLTILASSSLILSGCGGSSKQTTPTPTISPAAGSYTTAQTVTVTDSNANAALFCTTDGSVPTTSSPQCTAPITVSKSETINAIAQVPGFNPSSVATAAYTINEPIAATPTISPNGGTFATTQTVTISDTTSGATIYYTTNGTMPTTSSTQYTSGTPILVSTTETINAIAVATGYANSAEATATFTVTLTAATPVISPNGGTFTSAQTVTLTDATAGAAIYYTTNGTTPTTSSTQYITGTPITVSTTETINAIAVATGYNNSALATAAFTINLPSTATPTFSPVAGAVVSGTTVAISDATPGATIYYTTDGTTPTASSTQYNSSTPISVTQAETIEAIAIASGDSVSGVASAAYTIQALPSITGTVASGTLPVNGASVQLYAAGTSGYGAGATAVGSPVTTAANGSFKVTYTCPAAPGDQMYLVATGGTTSTTPSAPSNTGIALLTTLGTCANIPTSVPSTVTINEVTTIASAYALSPFATVNSSGPGIVIGAPAPSAACSTSGPATCNYKGLVNSFLMVNNLVNIGSGTALSITPYYSGHPLGTGTQPAPTTPVPYLNSSTVPQTRINTLADILATCVEDTGVGCGPLFTDATPPATGSAAPADTLQTALDIAQNPLNNVATLFGLPAATPPYNPWIGTANGAPNDFTLALTFTGGGLGSSTSGSVAVQNSGLAIDANGNIFVLAVTQLNNGIGMLAEFNNFGEAITAPTTVSTATPPVVTYGGFQSINAQSGSTNLPNGTGEVIQMAFDQSGNLWIPANNMNEVSTTPTLSLTSISLQSSAPGTGVAVDQAGNVWGAFTDLYEITNGAVAATYPSGTLGSQLTYPVFDSNGNLWAADTQTNLYAYSTAGTTPGTPLAKFTAPFSGYGFGPYYAADQAGNIYGCNVSTSAGLEVFNLSTSTTAPAANYTSPQGCGYGPIVLDGLGNVYTTDVSEQFLTVETSAGANLSGTTGYTGTSSSEPPVFPPFAGPQVMAVDGSGNLWALNGATANISGNTNNALVEFVGLAAPIVTPTSVALTDGELATRP